MKKFNRSLGMSTAVLLCAAAYAQPSFAADLGGPVFAEETFTPTVGPSWTAFYVGGQVGGVFSRSGVDDGCDNIESLDPDPITPLRGDLIADTQHYDYVGNLGGAFIPENIDCNTESDGDGTTWAGGVHFGADVQMGQIVLGAVVDFNWMDSGEQSSYFSYDLDQGVNTSTQTGEYQLVVAGQWSIDDIDNTPSAGFEASELGTAFREFWKTQNLEWYGTGRARAGVVMGNQGRFMLFGTGGVAFGQVETTLMQRATYTPDEADRVFDTGLDNVNLGLDEYFPNGDGNGNETNSLPDGCVNITYVGVQSSTGVACEDSLSDSSARIGWTAGFGGEYLVTNNFSVGLEALYVNLGEGSAVADLNPFDDGDLDFWTVMAKASFRIN